MEPISKRSVKDTLNESIPFSKVPTHNNLVSMINTWIHNREAIERAFDKQPGRCFRFGQYTVNFSGIDQHVTYNSIGECKICVFPNERRAYRDLGIPWYKLYNTTSYDGVITNHSVEIMEYRENQYKEAYMHLYNLFVDVLTFISKDNLINAFNKLITNALKYKHEWYSINGGTFYVYGSSPIPKHLTYYKFDDWSTVSFDHIIENYNIADITDVQPCKDPREEHWDHFIKVDHQLELNAKEKVNKYVSEVFEKVRNHESIPIEARVALIHDIRDVDKLNKIRKRYKLIVKHFGTDKVQKAIDKERKNIDNIIFGLYTGKL